MWELQSVIRVGKLTIWVTMIERTSSMLDETESKTVHKDEESDR